MTAPNAEDIRYPTGRPHVLVVTGEGDDRRYSLECPGVTDECAIYEECGCPESQPREEWGGESWFDWEGSNTAHGVEHQYLEGEWCKPTSNCYLIAPPEGLAGCFEDDDLSALSPGRYPVEYEFDDGFTIIRIADLATETAPKETR